MEPFSQKVVHISKVFNQKSMLKTVNACEHELVIQLMIPEHRC